MEFTDTQMLDWLALHPRSADIVIDGKATPCVFWGVSGHPDITLREAITKIMQATQPKE